MATLIVYPDSTEKLDALKAVMKALKIDFKEEKSPYSPEFNAKMNESVQQLKEGKTVKIDLDDIWK